MVKNNALTVGCFLREPSPAHGSGTAASSEYLVCEVGARGERFLGQGNVTAQTSQQEVHLKKSDKKSDKTKGQARV